MKCLDPDDRGPVLPPPDIADEATVQAFQAFGRVFHLHRQAMKRRLSNPRAHHGELICLRLLATTEGMSQRDLADTLHLSRPRVTSILQELEKAGEVRREADPHDQRITRVFLTDEGRRQEMEHRAAFEEYVQRTIGSLSEEERLELARLLDHVSNNIKELLCAGTHEPEVPVA
jgi:DNA-binding MarR family transcriptional regulator